MSSKITTATPLLTMRNVHIKGLSDETWVDIINGVDLDLRRGELLGLNGDSGAGKSTLGLAAMGFCRDGCKITDGRIEFDGLDLLSQSRQQLRQLRGRRFSQISPPVWMRTRWRRRFATRPSCSSVTSLRSRLSSPCSLATSSPCRHHS